MSAEQLATRIIAEQTGIPANGIRRGEIDQVEYEKIKNAAAALHSLPLNIDETGGLSIGQLAALARRFKRQRGLDLLVIDYLQLLQPENRAGRETRVQEVTVITTRLKALAKELNIPILALSQLSRQVEQRPDKRPQLSTLRESGSIEQDADVVMFVFREAYYHETEKPNDDEPKMDAWITRAEKIHNLAEVIIPKHRHGPSGVVDLHFEADLTRFQHAGPGAPAGACDDIARMPRAISRREP